AGRRPDAAPPSAGVGAPADAGPSRTPSRSREPWIMDVGRGRGAEGAPRESAGADGSGTREATVVRLDPHARAAKVVRIEDARGARRAPGRQGEVGSTSRRTSASTRMGRKGFAWYAS